MHSRLGARESIDRDHRANTEKDCGHDRTVFKRVADEAWAECRLHKQLRAEGGETAVIASPCLFRKLIEAVFSCSLRKSQPLGNFVGRIDNFLYNSVLSVFILGGRNKAYPYGCNYLASYGADRSRDPGYSVNRLSLLHKKPVLPDGTQSFPETVLIRDGFPIR